MAIHCSAWYLTMWSHWQVKAAPPESSLPHCVTVQPTELWQNEGSTSMHITPLTHRGDEIGGFENTRIWSTTSTQATRQLLLCYRSKPNQSATCCSSRLVPHTCEERCFYSKPQMAHKTWRECRRMPPLCFTSGFCRGNNNVNKPERCSSWIMSTIDHNTVCGQVCIPQEGRWKSLFDLWHQTGHAFMII